MKTYKNYPNSAMLLKRAKQLMPTASQTYSKSYKYYVEGASPAFLDLGKGAYVWDVDGNKYTDFVLGLGAVTIGYCDKRVNDAAIMQMEKGVSFSLPVNLEIDLAKKIIELIPCAEMVKFMKNGSDVTAAAVRLARAYTGRDIIACCGYHGWQDWYIGCTENDRGVPKEVKKLIRIFEYNNIKSLEKIFSQNKEKIAAVILEPVQLDEPRDDFLNKVKEIAYKNKALLIFDEVVTGFRISVKGAQDYFGVIPDLAAFGKGMGNGFSISALVGRRDIMRLIEERAFISTTFGGEAVSLAGALATIDILQKDINLKHFWNMGKYFTDSANKLIRRKNLQKVAKVSGLAPHCGIVFNNFGNFNNLELLSIFQQRMIHEGFLTIGINNFCLSHTKDDIDNFMKAALLGFEDVNAALKKGSLKGILFGQLIRPIFVRNSYVKDDQ